MSEIANITFQGVANEPSDHMHQDGELSLSVNAVKHNGSISPVAKGKVIFSFPEEWKLMYVHEYDDKKNYIFNISNEDSTNSLVYVKDDDIESGEIIEGKTECHVINTFDKSNSIRQVVCLKKVMCISTDEGNTYARLIYDEYEYLGSLPDLPYVYPYLTTSIDSVFSVDDSFIESSITDSDISPICSRFGGDNPDGKRYIFTKSSTCTQKIYNLLFANINSVRNKIHRDGGFCFPFYVRIAYRMYDGTHISISRPYLMRPSISNQPLCIGTCTEVNGTSSVQLFVMIPNAKLSMYIDDVDEKWKDVLTGIDVYVSSEIIDFTDSSESLNYAEKFDANILDDYGFTSLDESITTPSIYNINRCFVHKDLTSEDFSGKYIYSEVGTRTVSPYNDFAGKAWRKKHTFFNGYNILAVEKKYNARHFTGGVERLSTDDDRLSPEKTNLTQDDIDKYDWFFYDGGSKKVKFDADEYTVTLHEWNYRKIDSITDFDFSIKMSRTDGLSFNEALDTSTYYLIDSFDFEDRADDKLYSPDLEGKMILENLETRETLSEDVVNCEWTSSDSFSYNNRLASIVDQKKYKQIDFVNSFDSGDDFEKRDSDTDTDTDTDSSLSDGSSSSTSASAIGYDYYYEYINKLYVTINDGDRKRVVSSREYVGSDKDSYSSAETSGFRYFSYDSTSAEYVHVNVNRVLYKLPTFIISKDSVESTYELTEKLAKEFNTALEISCDAYYTLPLTVSEKGNFSYCENGGDPILDDTNNIVLIGGAWLVPSRDTINTMIRVLRYRIQFLHDLTESDIADSIDLTLESYKTQMSSFVSDTFGKEVTVTELTGTVTTGNEPPIDENDTDNFFDVGNTVYQSEVNNPFSFLNETSFLLPCDVVSRLAPSSLPISQGQFGEYPMYAFCDNGVWALKSNENGAFSYSSPVSIDVCTSPDSVTQLSQSVLFTTKRGLMEISGGQVSCVSEVLDGHNFTDNISKIDDVISISGVGKFDTPYHIQDILDESIIMYAYKRQCIYAFRPYSTDDKTHYLGYVYSITDNSWGQFDATNLEYSVPYPSHAYVVGSESGKQTLYDMDDPGDIEDTSISTMIITRPITFGLLDVYKTIDDIILRGVLDKGSMKMVIWASNNLKDWYIIGSSGGENGYKWRNYSGTPYKAYRIGVMANWREQDSLTGVDIIYTPRANNKIR